MDKGKIGEIDAGILKALHHLVKGATAVETIQEYIVNEGQKVLKSTKKVTKKMPPDLNSIKILLSLSNTYCDYQNLSDEELEKEKNKLIDLIANIKT